MFKKKKKIRSKFYSEVELHYVCPPFETLTQANGTCAVVDVIRDFTNPRRLNLKEFYWTVFLTKTNEVLGIAEIATGKQHSVAVDIKEIFQLALRTNADRLVIAHNHSANEHPITPSDADIRHTKSVKKVAEILEIQLVDSVILSSRGHYSLSAHNLL